MPRAVAPPPSGEFNIRLQKPFDGPPTHTIEVIGEPNRPATVKSSQYNGSDKSSEKEGDISADDVQELLSLISTCRGFTSNETKDTYGLDVVLDFNTMEIQWSNKEDDPAAASEVAAETKDEFKRVVDSIEALARQFAKRDAAI